MPISGYNPLLEALAKAARTRSSWNARLEHWERPASDSEEARIERAASMVRGALADNEWLIAQGVTIKPQGSYHNNTNVRLQADMDLRAMHPNLKVEYAPGVIEEYADNALGIRATGQTFSTTAQAMRSEILRGLANKFGANNLDLGNKAVRIKGLTGSRAEVDVVPAFRYFWVEWDAVRQTYIHAEGVAILGLDGNWIHNFPEQHHANGINKRALTKHRFKKSVRIMKRLRDELVEEEKLKAEQASSFLVECLTYAVEDEHFLVEDDDRYGRTIRIANRMATLLADPNWVQNATEINEIKFLFRPQQPWTVDDAKALVMAAHRQLMA